MNPFIFFFMGLIGAGTATLGMRGSSERSGGPGRGGGETPLGDSPTRPQPDDLESDGPEETDNTETSPDPSTDEPPLPGDSPADDPIVDETTDGGDEPSDGGSTTPEVPGSTDGEPTTLDLISGGAIGVHGLAIDGPITLEFSDTIRWGEGTLELRIFDGTSFVTVETFSGEDFGTEPDSAIRIVDNRLLIQPTSDLEILRDYAVRIEPGAVEGSDGTAFPGVADDATVTFVSGIGVVPPSLDPDDYDRVIVGETFTETVYVDQDYNNTLFIDCIFRDIDGYGMKLGDVSNVTIYNCAFENISETGILLRSTLSTDSVSIISNTFEDIGGDAIHAAKRFETGVDHQNLLIQDNQIHDVGLNGGSIYHGIYTQSSEAVIWGNSITGYVDSNAISIRGDGIVWDNYINVTSGRDDYGSAIKYYSDHETGDSKTLIIADNVIESSSLYSGIELTMATQAIPDSYAYEDWVVSDFQIMRNTVEARNDYVIDPLLEQQSWASIGIYEEDLPTASTATLAALLPAIEVEQAAYLPDPDEALELEAML